MSNIVTIEHIKTVYFVGIKGVGMTALAAIVHEMGKTVLGSDNGDSFGTDSVLHEKHISVYEGFDPEHVVELAKKYPGELLVITTGAHGGMKNPEVVKALSLSIPVLSHGEALGLIMKSKRGISVSGTHGKSTTSAMIAHILSMAGKDPAYAIGVSGIATLGYPGHWGEGEWFVAEADEYVTDPGTDKTPRFHHQHPEVGIITSIDYDHPDVFASLDEVKRAFMQFAKQVEKLLVFNKDDVNVRSVVSRIQPATSYSYGQDAEADIRLVSYNAQYQKAHVSVRVGMTQRQFMLSVPGRHNALNACAAVGVCSYAGLSWSEIASGLETFRGTKRRFEFVAEHNNVLYYDDYAHHPAEIRATLAAAKEWFSGHRIKVIFQPHTYSRTKALLDEFATSFVDADMVFITPIFASARETPDASVTGKSLAAAVSRHHPSVLYVESPDNVVPAIKKNDILITMGAGDVYKWHEKL